MKRAAWIPAIVVAGLVFLSACSHSYPSKRSAGVTNGPKSSADGFSSRPEASGLSDVPVDWGNEPFPDKAHIRHLEARTPPDSNHPLKTAYLTFDDGPSVNTEQILDILRRYGVKATFFVIGEPSENGVKLYKKIVDDGHVLGNHTFSHDYPVVYKSVSAFRLDVERLSRLLEQSTGKRPDILRFPGGSNNRQARKYGGPRIMSAVAAEMQKEGYAYFDWNVSSTDAAAAVQKRDEIVGSVLGSAQDKTNIIVLMHDAKRKTTTIEALPDIIQGLRSQGFQFDVLRKGSFTFRLLKP